MYFCRQFIYILRVFFAHPHYTLLCLRTFFTLYTNFFSSLIYFASFFWQVILQVCEMLNAAKELCSEGIRNLEDTHSKIIVCYHIISINFYNKYIIKDLFPHTSQSKRVIWWIYNTNLQFTLAPAIRNVCY